MTLPPENKTIIPPKFGWQESTWYLVEVSYRKSNPIHNALFYSGFLNGPGLEGERGPGGYNGFIPLNGPDFEDLPKKFHEAHYLRVVKALVSSKIGLLCPECHGEGEVGGPYYGHVSCNICEGKGTV